MTRPPGTSGGDDADGPAGTAVQLGRYAGFGLTMGLATALFAWLGTWVDGRLGTEPLFVVIGAFLGFAAGFYSMYWRLVLRPAREREDAAREPGGGEGRGGA